MLISRRSLRRRNAFRSRFQDAEGDFPLRRYMRCREDIYSGIIHSVLQVAFLIALIFFGRAIWLVFARHGAELSPIYSWGAMLLLAAFWLLVLRRLLRKLGDVREARQEMAELRAELERHRKGDSA